MNKRNFEFILSEGEGQYIEFKEKFGEGFAKEIVAFANASGGKILLGIDDKRKVNGIKITNKLKSQIQDLANSCDPRIEISFEEFESVLIINILEGKNKPYSCKTEFKELGKKFYTIFYRKILTPQDTPQDTPQRPTELEKKILDIIKQDLTITREGIANKLKLNSDTIKEYLSKLKNKRLLLRVGGRRYGHWEIK